MKKIINVINCILINILLVSCATSTYDQKEFEKSYLNAKEKFYEIPRFGFIAHGKKYDFGIGALSDECEYILAYEEGTLKYKIPYDYIYELAKVFKQTVDLETKSKAILSQIEKIDSKNLSCKQKINTSKELLKNMDPVNAAVSVVFWTPIVALGVIMIPFQADLFIDYLKYSPKIDKIKLEMTIDQTKELFGENPTIYKDKNLLILKYKNQALNLLMIFENNKLVGYLLGEEAEYEYLKTGEDSVIIPYLKKSNKK